MIDSQYKSDTSLALRRAETLTDSTVLIKQAIHQSINQLSRVLINRGYRLTKKTRNLWTAPIPANPVEISFNKSTKQKTLTNPALLQPPAIVQTITFVL